MSLDKTIEGINSILPIVSYRNTNMCQCTLFDVGGVEIHSIECIEYCTKDQSNVEDVEDRSNTPKGCNAMYVGDVEDGKRTYTHILAHNFLNT